MTNAPEQLIQDIIPESIDSDCGRCMLLEEENKRLNKLMQGWDKTEAEIKTEAINDFMYKIINNQFYNKNDLIVFYRNYVKELEYDK